jgi:Zn-finger protein
MICSAYFCEKEITSKTSHNGVPVWRGRVCSDCNLIVTQKRIENINKRLPRNYTVEEDV